jgi:hypothetical protein
MARPSKLNPEVQAEIVEAVAAGSSRDAAALAAGVSPSSLDAWLARGKNASTVPFYHDFRVAVIKASSRANRERVFILREAAKSDWRAAWVWLAAHEPAVWSRNAPIIRELKQWLAKVEARLRETASRA